MKKERRHQIEVSFHVPENLYGEFKQICKYKKQLPASILKKLMMFYIDKMQYEKELEKERNTKWKGIEL